MRGGVSKRLILLTKNEKYTRQVIADFTTLLTKNVIAYVLPTVKALVTHF